MTNELATSVKQESRGFVFIGSMEGFEREGVKREREGERERERVVEEGRGRKLRGMAG